jgi:peptidyl-prolyl isomerase E (cyclophilin E)
MVIVLDGKHRGFAFVTFASSADAHDAIDNMDLNVLRGRVIKVNLARPMKGIAQPDGSRASKNADADAIQLLTSISTLFSLGVGRMAPETRQASGTKRRCERLIYHERSY